MSLAKGIHTPLTLEIYTAQKSQLRPKLVLGKNFWIKKNLGKKDFWIKKDFGPIFLSKKTKQEGLTQGEDIWPPPPRI